MKNQFLLVCLVILLAGTANAQYFFYNATKDTLKYEATMPNTLVEKGEIEPSSGNRPKKTLFYATEQVAIPVKVLTADGKVIADGSYDAGSINVVFATSEGHKVKTIGTFLEDRGRQGGVFFTLINLTGKSQTFDIIDKKTVRKSETLAHGEMKTYTGENGFDSYNYEHKFRFPNGELADDESRAPGVHFMFQDPRRPKAPTFFSTQSYPLP